MLHFTKQLWTKTKTFTKWKDLFLDVLVSIFFFLSAMVFTHYLPMRDRYVDFSVGSYLSKTPSDEPGWVMTIFVWIIPVLYISLIHGIYVRSAGKTILTLVSWLNAISLAVFFMSIVRYFLPTPRPYFFDVCKPRQTRGFFIKDDICTKIIERRDMQSFPSGHTTIIWTSWLFVVFALSSSIGAFHRSGNFWKLFFVVALPLSFPLWMSCERIASGNHSEYDVSGGFFIGLISVTVVFLNMDKERLFVKHNVESENV